MWEKWARTLLIAVKVQRSQKGMKTEPECGGKQKYYACGDTNKTQTNLYKGGGRGHNSPNYGHRKNKKVGPRWTVWVQEITDETKWRDRVSPSKKSTNGERAWATAKNRRGRWPIGKSQEWGTP